MVKSREGEGFEQLLKRFKKQCEKAGILSDVKKKEHFEKPSVRLKKKSIAARKRLMKKQKKFGEPRRGGSYDMKPDRGDKPERGGRGGSGGGYSDGGSSGGYSGGGY
jgi:small subunit ribosomal protein S21